MEYGSVVWNPYELGDIAQIESIQKQFLLYALRGLGWRTDTYSLPSYESRLKLINLETLEFRRFKTDVLFAFACCVEIFLVMSYVTSYKETKMVGI